MARDHRRTGGVSQRTGLLHTASVSLMALLLCLSPAWAEPGPAADGARVMVVFEEEIKGVFGIVEQWVNLSRAETVIGQKLRAAGYQVVDPQAVKRTITRDQALEALNGDAAAAAAAGLRYEAPIVIVGKSLALSTGSVLGSSMNSIHAEVQAKIYRSSDGRMFTARSASATVPHIDVVKGGDVAIERAATELAERLTQDLEGFDLDGGRSPDGSPIRVTISGLASYRQLAFIRDFLSANVDGVKKVEQKTFISGTGDLDVTFVGGGTKLADQLAFGSFQGFRLEPIAAESSVVTLKVIPAQ